MGKSLERSTQAISTFYKNIFLKKIYFM